MVRLPKYSTLPYIRGNARWIRIRPIRSLLQNIELGIVQWALPGAELAAWTDALVDRIAGYSAATLASSKACIAAEADPGIDGFALEMAKNRMLLETEETQELVAAFFQRGRDA